MTLTPARRKPPARLRPFWIPFTLAALLAVVGGYEAAIWPGFYPKHVVVTGNSVVSTSQILAHAEVKRRESIWLQSPTAIARRVEALAYIRTAVVHRWWPNGVRITVTQRRPFAVVVSGERRVLVDRDLRVLAPGAAPGLPRLILPSGVPLATGAFLREARLRALRADARLLHAAGIGITRLAYDHFGSLVATMPSGMLLLLGSDSQLSHTLPLVRPLLERTARERQRVITIDLRSPSTPILIFK